MSDLEPWVFEFKNELTKSCRENLSMKFSRYPNVIERFIESEREAWMLLHDNGWFSKSKRTEFLEILKTTPGCERLYQCVREKDPINKITQIFNKEKFLEQLKSNSVDDQQVIIEPSIESLKLELMRKDKELIAILDRKNDMKFELDSCKKELHKKNEELEKKNEELEKKNEELEFANELIDNLREGLKETQAELEKVKMMNLNSVN